MAPPSVYGDYVRSLAIRFTVLRQPRSDPGTYLVIGTGPLVETQLRTGIATTPAHRSRYVHLFIKLPAIELPRIQSLCSVHSCLTRSSLTDEGRALLIQRAERFAVTCGIGAIDRDAAAGATSSGLRRRMTGARDEKPKRCPDCGAAVPERDPLVGWWCCDDCGILLDDGERLT